MAALASVFIVLTLSLLINRIATVALTLTGLSRQAAQFQARSAFTGAGFTTDEAERVVNHPVRRRIIMWLMLLGNAGIVTTISSLLLTFTNIGQSESWVLRAVLLGVGLLVLWGLATSAWIDRYLSRLIRRALRRWTHLNVRDYASLLHLSGEYTVTELVVQESDWVADRKLKMLELREEGILVLGIRRANGRYVGAPKGETSIHANDTLLLYGRLSQLSELDERRADLLGERSHHQAVEEQQRMLEQQDREEAADREGEKPRENG
ncbi:hypothetical protein CKA32_002703 [Geitlerinema sp. FC II]|nr:TrkA C-terminal domain-containing protein [Geitlerinema sp. CS-897]PPT06159.1 hypothetical protein CKA32_002703 [Geitlerinema sp. FC II]